MRRGEAGGEPPGGGHARSPSTTTGARSTYLLLALDVKVLAARGDVALVVLLVDRDAALGAVGPFDLAIEVGALLGLLIARALDRLRLHRARVGDLPGQVLGLSLIDLGLAAAGDEGDERYSERHC